MAISDPELEMLTELLEDDPGAEEFITVGKEYLSRGVWSEAVRVLVAGLKASPDMLMGWELLATASLEDGQYARAVDALGKLPASTLSERRIGRIRVLALSGAGELEAARAAATEYLRAHPHDDDVQGVLDRDDTPQIGGNRASDPFVTTERAEQYVLMGRPDRAIRAYRRILFHNPGNASLQRRLRELMDEPVLAEDDLSEEISLDLLDAPLAPELSPLDVAPPEFDMPSPSIGVADEEWDDVPDLDMPDIGLSLAETVLPDKEVTGLDLSRAQLRELIEEQRFIEDNTDHGDAEKVAEAPTVEHQAIDIVAARQVAHEADLDPADQQVTLDATPTNVVAKGTDIAELTKKVKKVKRRRSLFRR